MAAITISLFLFFLHIFSIVKSQTTQSKITLGSQLLPTQERTSWLSSSGRYAFGFYKQGDGFAVGIWLNQIPEKTVVWTAKRDDKPVSSDTTVLLTKEGWLVLRDKRGQDTPITNSSSSATYASMLNTGNFVLYNAVSEIVWQSFNNPTDTILANMTLSSGNQVFSSASETNHSRGRFRLKNQDDGNLVLYPADTTDIAENAYWASGIFDQGYRPTLALDEDGHMYLFREDGKIVRNFTDGWASRNQTVFYRATIDFDGIFRLYSHSVEWNGSYSTEIRWSAIDDKCMVKGICGFNSYCSLEDNRTGCLCLPGFDFVDPLQRFRGCERNFTEQSCGDRTDNLTYVMQTMENMVLEDDPYSISQVWNMDDCGKACLYDCTCHASLLRNGRCSKLKLPLRYGRRGTDKSTTIFIKVGDGTLESPNRTFPTRTEMRSKKMIRMDILAVSIALVTCSVIAILISCLLIYRYHRRSKLMSPKEDFGLMEEIFLRSFSYDELKKATGNFKEELGNGAFGTVYKGVLSNSQKAIAVKTLTKMVREGEKEFQREMKAIGRTHHRNLIQLLGFCSEGSNRLLVYEYMKNGSLADLPKVEDLVTFIESAKIAMMTTRIKSTGQLVSRAMAIAAKENGGVDLLFHTNTESGKTDDIDSDPSINISFLDAFGQWASISGTSEVVTDRSLVEKYYSPALKAWFGDLGDGKHDGGPQDPRLGVIRVKSNSVNYAVNNKNILARGFEVAKGAVTGEAAQVNALRHISESELNQWRSVNK